jgi:hypothetical protein
MSYPGKILLFNDANDRNHLIFNHYNPDLTQDQIHAEILSQFGLQYKFGNEQDMGLVYDNGNVLTEISSVYTPDQLLNEFNETPHPDVPATIPPSPITAADLRVILYTKMEPPYGNTPAIQTVGSNRGGRYFKTNYSLSVALTANSDRVHQNTWDGYNPVRYVITNTNPQSIAINPTTNVSDTQLSFTNVNERSDQTAASSILDEKPKAIFYVYSRGSDEFLQSNFAQDTNRVYQLVKPYLIGGPIIATTTQELEDTVLDKFDNYDISFAEIARQIKALQDKDIDLDGEISDLKQADGTLQSNINTKKSDSDATEDKAELQGNIDVVNVNLAKISVVCSAISNTQHNFYNYEWTNWSAPISVDKTLNSSSEIIMIEMANIQERATRKRQIINDTAKMMKNVKSDIVKLAKINSTVLELLNENL